jgi:hypothetical protein
LKEESLSKEHLATYLNDHLAGANFAVEVLDHLASENPDLKPSLDALKKDIEEDREQLRILMRHLNVPESRVRKAGSWIAESVAEVKLDVDDDPHGPLRRLERLEALAIGIDGKVALWQALQATPPNAALAGVDYELLTHRGQEQRSRVEVLRLQAARAALAA